MLSLQAITPGVFEKLRKDGARAIESKVANAGRVLLVGNSDWNLYNFRLPLARALRRAGLEVVLVCPGGNYVRELEREGFRCVLWRLDRRSMNPLREARAVLDLFHIYRRERPQVVHHFTIKPILYGTFAALKAGVPVIINAFTGLGTMLGSGATWRQPGVVLLRPFVVVAFLRWLLRKPNVWTIVLNEADAQFFMRLQSKRGLPPKVVLDEGVDIRRFVPRAKSDDDASPPCVIMAARLLWDKGVAEFVEAARLLRRHGVRARFLVAGAVDPGNPTAVDEETLVRWRSEGVVEFLGHRTDMPELLAGCHIAVLPSYHEGLPRFLLEAAACGLPLVASDIPGCRCVVRPGVNGLLVPVRNPQALAEAIGHLLEDPDLRQRYGEASRRIAVEEFAEERALEEYLAVYREAGVLYENAKTVLVEEAGNHDPPDTP